MIALTVEVVVQAPPPPPEFAQIFSSGPPLAEVIMTVVAIAAALIAAIFILGPVARAFARRVEGRVPDALQDELEHMKGKVLDMDDLRARLAEVEERLDFTERILAQQPPPGQLRSPDAAS